VNQESLTIAYDSKGNVKWRAFLGQDANGLDVAVDAAGNVYVLSIFYPDSYLPEVVTAKYSPSGVRQWVDFIASKPSFFNNPSTAYRPVKLAVSPEGNVYVGITKVDQIPNPTPGSGPGTTINAIAFKYDTNGKQIWTKEAPPTPNQYNSAVSIRLDAAENVYVLVFSLFNSQIHDSFIVKYDSNGNFLNTYGSSQLGTIAAFRVDASGNSYVAGGGSPQPPNGKEDRIVAKFSPAGVLDWLHDFGAEFPTIAQTASGTVVASSFADLAVNSAGNVFVAQTLPGAIPSFGTFDISVVKFNSTGTIQWTSRFNGHSDDSDADQAVAIAVNSGGYTYVTGYGSVGLATIKYDRNGKQIWAEVKSGPFPVSLALSGGDVIATGDINGATTSADWFTIDFVQDVGGLAGTVTVHDNWSGSAVHPQTVQLSGTGTT